MKAAKQNSGRKKYGLYVGGTWGIWLFLSVLFYVLALGPQTALLARLHKDFVSSNEEYSLAQTAGRPEAQAKLEQKLQDARQKSAYFIVQPDNTAGLILQISQLAARHQLQDFSSRIAKTPSASKKNDVSSSVAEAWLELEFSGSFPQIASFINSLERNDPVVFIENMDIRHSPREDKLPSASIQISYLTGKPETKKTESASLGDSKSKKKKDSGN